MPSLFSVLVIFAIFAVAYVVFGRYLGRVFGVVLLGRMTARLLWLGYHRLQRSEGRVDIASADD